MTNHVAYLESWLKGMNGDPRFIFRAAAQASKAVEFVLSFSRDRVAIVEPAGDEFRSEDPLPRSTATADREAP